MSVKMGSVGMALAMVLAISGAGCKGAPSESGLLEGEAAGALAVSEEEDPALVAEGAATTLGDAELSEAADEVVASEADAEPAGESAGWRPCDFSALRERARHAFDANGNGRIDSGEMVRMREQVGDAVRSRFGQGIFEATQRFRHIAMIRVRWAFDEDNDGRLSLEERTALVDALEQRCQALRQRALQRWDANGNGTLDPEELQAAREALRERLQARRAEVLAQFDANQNGQLDPEERQALHEARLQRLRERREALRATFDANGNGTLEPEEIAALKAWIRERVANAGEGG